ncbi:reverse transcriptase domain-containing protein [Gallaecimonas pentaromativorans]|uniref:reverse transcriptase domain-containing protein n=1 Tax=Gallaecimonas pentaromativorans TaxID=584787 RepID=UPI003A957FE6
MDKRTFEQAFNAVFHKKESFDDFLNIDLESETTLLNIKDRIVIRQSDRLKKYLRFVDKVVLRYLARDEEVVHSFIKNKSTLTAVKAHVDNKYFFLSDIRDFYKNIKNSDILKILDRDKELIPIEDFERYIRFLPSITTYRGSIPVGFSTSPQLSNAFLFDFDREMKKTCIENSMVYSRYADDIIISGNNLDEISELANQVQKKLHDFGSPNLFLKESKTRITWKGNKVKILGLVILPNGRITIDKKYKILIETLLHFYATDSTQYQILLSKSLKNDEKSLFGLLHYANSVDPSYLEKLQRKYGALSLHTLMEEKEIEK